MSSEPENRRTQPTRGSHTITLALAAVLAGFLAYCLYALHTIYLTRGFAFHDLSQYNDFLANTILHGRFFYIADYDQSHFTYHLTPTLLLLTPLYLVFSSQFVGVALGAVCLTGALFFAAMILKLFLERAAAGPTLVALYLTAFLVPAALNRFTVNVIASAHWHPVFTLLAVVLLYLLLIDARPWLIGAVTVLVLGVRQDAGFFLFFPLTSLFFLPRELLADRRRLYRRTAILCGVCAAYTLVAVKVIFPLVGGQQAYQLSKWSRFGGSWEEILGNMLRPDLLGPALNESAFVALNKSFALVHFLNPAVGVLANLPGTLFFVADNIQKKLLLQYEASLLLPAFFLATAAGLFNLHRIARWVVRRFDLRAGVLLLAPLLLLPIASYRVERSWRRYSQELTLRRTAGAEAYVRRVREGVASCPGATRVASDFRTVVFLPTSIMKYMLRNYDQAEMVIFDPRETAFMSGYVDLEAFRSTIRADAAYEATSVTPDLELFVRRGSVCDR